MTGRAAFFFGIWLFTYLVYPSWALPISQTGRFYVFVALSGYCFFSFVLVRLFFSRLEKAPQRVPDREDRAEDKRWFGWLAGFGLLSIAARGYPLTFPIVDDDDEAYHVSSALTLYEKLDEMTQRTFHLEALTLFRTLLMAAALLAAVYLCFPKAVQLKLKDWKRKITKVAWLALPLFLLGNYLAAKDMTYAPGFFLFPPISKFLHLFMYLIFGISEWKVRLVSLFFSVASSFLLFKLVRLFRDGKTAFLSALLILFFPNCFYYGTVAELGAGLLFFAVLSSFCFLRYWKRGGVPELFWAAVTAVIGFFYHRMLAILPLTFLCFGLLEMKGQAQRRRALSHLSLFAVLVFISFFPWVLFGYLFSSRNYRFIPSSLVDLQKLQSYLLQMPSQITPLFAFLFFASFLYLVLKRCDVLNRFSAVLYLCSYLFVTGDRTVTWLSRGVPRYGLLLYPAIAIFIAQGCIVFLNRLHSPTRFQGALACGMVAYFLLLSTVVNLPPVGQRYTRYLQRSASQYHAYDEGFRFIQEKISPDVRIFDPLGMNHLKFYAYKYGILHWNQEPAYELIERPSDEALYQKCRREKYDYVFCSRGNLGDSFQLVEVFSTAKEKRFLWKVL